MESISKPKVLVGKQRTKRKKIMQTSPHGLCACANMCEGHAFWVVVGTRTVRG